MKSDRLIYVIDDDKALARSIGKMLSSEGYEVEVFFDAENGLDQVKKYRPDLIISDVRLPGMDGIKLVREVSETSRHLPIILTTAYGSTDMAIEATKAGAYDFVEKPFQPDSFLDLVEKAFNSFSLAARDVEMGGGEDAKRQSIIGSSSAMKEIYKQIGRVAATPVSVLIRGETGTGKELIAQALFHHSNRADQPFMAVNCMAIPHNLIESELFGHEKGAFTGAHARRIGRFEQARNGTLFLDEIGDLPMSTQAKLLRVLQEGVIQRVGSNLDIKISTRVIAATHRNLESAIRKKTFREDLFYRLGTVQIMVPPLRERPDDIKKLAEYFLKLYSIRFGAATPSIVPSALTLLEKQSWPGNVRELQNVIQKAIIESRGLPITREVVDRSLYRHVPHRDECTPELTDWLESRLNQALNANETRLMESVQREIEEHLLRAVGDRVLWNKTKLAEVLGWSRPTVYQKLKEYDLQPARKKKAGK